MRSSLCTRRIVQCPTRPLAQTVGFVSQGYRPKSSAALKPMPKRSSGTGTSPDGCPCAAAGSQSECQAPQRPLVDDNSVFAYLPVEVIVDPKGREHVQAMVEKARAGQKGFAVAR